MMYGHGLVSQMTMHGCMLLAGQPNLVGVHIGSFPAVAMRQDVKSRRGTRAMCAIEPIWRFGAVAAFWYAISIEAGFWKAAPHRGCERCN